jgi:hypothetical protein
MPSGHFAAQCQYFGLFEALLKTESLIWGRLRGGNQGETQRQSG